MYRSIIIHGACCLAISLPASSAELSTLLGSGIQVIAVEKPFTSADHAITGCKSFQPCLVDGQKVFGAIGLPRTILEKVSLRYGDASYELDVRGMFDPMLGTDLKGRWDGYCYDSRNCTLRAVFSDAGGAYCAEWQIVNGVATRTILTDSMDVVKFIRANLVAPRYE